ncbi:hypothetical protein DL95DRAFT_464376 [Leptodontidium sp. 2 PMI_412]|nr:hypothetical protein BKA61DRAFT_674888 [Leptodontidium sp. MPI-SDFR-AT-0119]KAH9211981.1 hypothetical protein DL95DRAFT_464376 [Leptodontidium sp. 2 PMI_412]
MNRADVSPASIGTAIHASGHVTPVSRVPGGCSIYRLNFGDSDKIFISTHELLDEVYDEKGFTTMVSGALDQIRNGVHAGWSLHSLLRRTQLGGSSQSLMPAFGPLSIRSMFDDRHDIASQLVVKWARFGPKERINVPDDFTRMRSFALANTTLPTGRQPISLMDILGLYAELSQPATRKNIARIAASCPDEIVRASISALAGKDFEQEILNKRRSPLDILNTPAR